MPGPLRRGRGRWVCAARKEGAAGRQGRWPSLGYGAHTPTAVGAAKAGERGAARGGRRRRRCPRAARAGRGPRGGGAAGGRRGRPWGRRGWPRARGTRGGTRGGSGARRRTRQPRSGTRSGTWQTGGTCQRRVAIRAGAQAAAGAWRTKGRGGGPCDCGDWTLYASFCVQSSTRGRWTGQAGAYTCAAQTGQLAGGSCAWARSAGEGCRELGADPMACSRAGQRQPASWEHVALPSHAAGGPVPGICPGGNGGGRGRGALWAPGAAGAEAPQRSRRCPARSAWGGAIHDGSVHAAQRVAAEEPRSHRRVGRESVRGGRDSRPAFWTEGRAAPLTRGKRGLRGVGSLAEGLGSFVSGC